MCESPCAPFRIHSQNVRATVFGDGIATVNNNNTFICSYIYNFTKKLDIYKLVEGLKTFTIESGD